MHVWLMPISRLPCRGYLAVFLSSPDINGFSQPPVPCYRTYYNHRLERTAREQCHMTKSSEIPRRYRCIGPRPCDVSVVPSPVAVRAMRK